MLALSIVINRPFCHINAYDNDKKSNESIPGIICTHQEQSNYHFHITHAFNFQLNLNPICFILYERHFVPLIPTSSNIEIFDFKRTVLNNQYNDFILSDELVN